MNRIVPGACPRGRSPNLSHSRGFSLVEVMMSIVLLAVSAALAIPSYRDMVEKRQLTNGAQQMAAFINSAQSAAMKSNQVVTVAYSRTSNSDWCIGASRGTDECDCTETRPAESTYCQIDSQPYILNGAHADSRNLVYAMTGDGSYAFDPIRGLFTDLDDSLTVDLRSQNQDFQLKLMVNNTGRVVLCSTDARHAIPGYELCPAPLRIEAQPL